MGRASDGTERRVAMTQIASGVDALRAALTGAATLPDDPGYDQVRPVWNADVDRRRGAIARCGRIRRCRGARVRHQCGLGDRDSLRRSQLLVHIETGALPPSTAV